MVRRIDTSSPAILGRWVVISGATLTFFAVDILSVSATFDHVVFPKEPVFAKLWNEELDDVDEGSRL